MSAREAKNGVGHLIDLARAESVMIEKHGRGVVVGIAVEEYNRLAETAKAVASSRAIETLEKRGD